GGGGHSPLYRRPRESSLDMRVFGNVAIVVAIDEAVPCHRVVQGECSDREKQAENDSSLLRRRKQALARLSGLWALSRGGCRHDNPVSAVIASTARLAGTQKGTARCLFSPVVLE